MKNGSVNSIEKISKQSAVDLVLEQMKSLIKNGVWEVGHRIPSESELADMFAVNRLTVRLALQKLNIFGLVQTRVGEGTFVTEFSFIGYIRQVSEFYEQDVFDDIADFREAVELHCCALAMKRATKKELAELNKLLIEHERIQKQLDDDLSDDNFTEEIYLEIVDVDLRFHEYICIMAKNSLLKASFEMARDATYQHLLMIVRKRLSQRREKIRQGNVIRRDIHRDIYESIVNNDFEKCRRAYLDMVNQRINLYEFS